MIDRRRLVLAALVLAFAPGLAPAARADEAGPARPYVQKDFDAALASGGPVVVQVSAPWCPICRAQKPILASLLAEPRFADFALFDISFDDDKTSMRAVGARLQSTLIVYREGREIARTVGDREQGWIEDLLEKALPPKAAAAAEPR